MSTTFRQFIMDALSDAGTQNPGQTSSTVAYANAVRKYGDMMESWAANRLRLNYIPEVAYTLQANVSSYEVGVGAAHFPVSGGYVKPNFVQSGVVVVGTARRWPLNILTAPQWNSSGSRGGTHPDGPIDFNYDDGTPIAHFNVAPAPSGSQAMYLDIWAPFRTFVAITDDALVMEAYFSGEMIRAMRIGLVFELAPGYRLKPDMASQFQDAIGIVERKNNAKLGGSIGSSRTADNPVIGDGSPVAGGGR